MVGFGGSLISSCLLYIAVFAFDVFCWCLFELGEGRVYFSSSGAGMCLLNRVRFSFGICDAVDSAVLSGRELSLCCHSESGLK